MVRSLGAARAAALIGVTADASSTAPTTTERSRRFQGARLRYSRRTCSGSACATIVMRPWLRSPDLGAVPPIPMALQESLEDAAQARLVVYDQDGRRLPWW